MFKSLVIIAIGWALTGGGEAFPASVRSRQQPELAAEFYWVGHPDRSLPSEVGYLKKVLHDPLTQEMWRSISARLAAHMREGLFSKESLIPEESLATLDVLLADLPKAELVLQLWEHPSGEMAWALAMNLEHQDVEAWEGALRYLAELESARPTRDFRSPLARGWEVLGFRGTHLLRLLRINHWLLVSDSPGDDSVLGRMLENLLITGHPYSRTRDCLVSGMINLKRIMPHLSLPEWLVSSIREWPMVEFRTGPGSGKLRSLAQVHFQTPHGVEMAPWHIPLQTIHEPLNSFTALQGIRPWLDNVEILHRLQFTPVPNQLFTWSLAGQPPFRTMLAFPMNNVTNVLENSAQRLIRYANPDLQKLNLGQIEWVDKSSRILWHGVLPAMFPYLQPAIEPTGQFVAGGLFPMAPDTTADPPPEELIDQVRGRTNLVFYHWEITAERLEQWQSILQLVDLAVYGFHKPKSPEERESHQLARFPLTHQWLELVRPYAGNTVTEATIVSPHQFQLERSSHFGLTALEWLGLMRYLESAGYLDRVSNRMSPEAAKAAVPATVFPSAPVPKSP